MYDLECVADNVVCLGQRSEGGQYLVVDAFGQEHLVKGILEPVPALFTGGDQLLLFSRYPPATGVVNAG